MKPHQLIYYKFFDVDYKDPTAYQPSEIDDRQKGVDIHHIICRGMGGDPNGELDRIENLMLLTAKEHEDYGDKVQYMSHLFKIHKHRLKKTGKPFDEKWINEQIKIYEAKAQEVC